MKILITGGNGYIAKSLYNSLKNFDEEIPKIVEYYKNRFIW
jgi:UDP-glucose 4-epimerase